MIAHLKNVNWMCYNCKNLESIKPGEISLDGDPLVFDMYTKSNDLVGSTALINSFY